MSAEQITVWVLIFLAVACAVWGICNMIPETDKDNSEKLPLLFRIFSPGIYFFAAEAGSLLESSFPKHSAELGEDLKKAALPMDVKDLYGAQLGHQFPKAGILYQKLALVGQVKRSSVRSCHSASTK